MIERNYNYRKQMKEREKKRHYFLREKYCCRPRSPKISFNQAGVEYIVEGTSDKKKGFLKKQASKKARVNMNLSNGANYKKTFALIYEWYWWNGEHTEETKI